MTKQFKTITKLLYRARCLDKSPRLFYSVSSESVLTGAAHANGATMAQFCNYYNVGTLDLTAEELHRSKPRLLTFSKIKNGPRGEVSPHTHPHLEIFYFESGAGYFECGGETFPIHADDLLVVDAKRLHVQYSEDKRTPLTYYCFAVDNLRLKGHALNCMTGKGFFIHPFGSQKNDVHLTILQILTELRDKRYGYVTKVDSIFSRLLIDILRLSPASDDGVNASDTYLANRNLLNGVKEYIEEHYAEDITLSDLTKVSFMDKSYFLHQFKKQFNISPMHYLTLVRVEQGKRLLTNTTRTVTQIAADVGINNPVYFTELFTKAIGVPPTTYRKIIFGDIEFM